MTTKEIIEKIESNGLKSANAYSQLIWEARTKGDQSMADEYRYKLRGYLTALKEVGILSDWEMRAANLWYCTREHENA